MSTDRVGPFEGHVDGYTVTIVVKCGFIGCPWSMAIGTAPLEAHAAYIEHLDVHDPDNIVAEDHSDCEAVEHAVHHEAPAAVGYTVEVNGGLYAGDTAEEIATEQARVDRFMHGEEDR